MHSLKLPFEFDASVLRSELAQFAKSDYRDIYNPSVMLETLWLIELISPKRKAGMDSEVVFLPNENLKKCPHLLSIFNTFQCSVETFRIHTLDAGASIKPHRDTGFCFEHGKIRLHVPIKTNDNVEILLENKNVKMKEGECWYCNFNILHEVHNKGEEARIHLIIDCMVNDWVKDLFATSVN